MKLREISPNTLAGSFSNDLIIRKIWALEELEKIATDFHNIYVLGSWYGNMGFILDKASSISYDTIVNVDIDKQAIRASKAIYKKAEIKNSKFLNVDANDLTYKNADLVINTSVNNIRGQDWFKKIPSGCLVLIQGRTNDPGATNTFQTLADFKAAFSFNKILYAGKITLASNDDDFDSFMVIGIK